MSIFKLLKIFLVSSLIITTLALVYFLVFKFDFLKTGLFTVAKTSGDKNNSVFNTMPPNKTGTTTLEINYNKYANNLKNEPEGMTIFGLGTSLESYNFNATWDYVKTPFWAKVNAVYKDASKLTLRFIQPSDMPYLNTDTDVEVAGCSRENSFLQDKTQNINASRLDLFNEIKEGDNFIGFCLNAECTQVGKLCKIYRE